MEATCYSKSQTHFILSSPAGSLKLLSIQRSTRLTKLMITYSKRFRDSSRIIKSYKRKRRSQRSNKNQSKKYTKKKLQSNSQSARSQTSPMS